MFQTEVVEVKRHGHLAVRENLTQDVIEGHCWILGLKRVRISHSMLDFISIVHLTFLS